eukprot:TRINITY_DN2895_c0_g1_i1.p1 TRINITY_DN2895_c0_g1~~TRINITY_DN2895_c0_g1_i1.p1  ORF type:complete len:392 (-),score=6.56 TRINITY_DN2895_c0_g1_i1:322-1497(-)
MSKERLKHIRGCRKRLRVKIQFVSNISQTQQNSCCLYMNLKILQVATKVCLLRLLLDLLHHSQVLLLRSRLHHTLCHFLMLILSQTRYNIISYRILHSKDQWINRLHFRQELLWVHRLWKQKKATLLIVHQKPEEFPCLQAMNRLQCVHSGLVLLQRIPVRKILLCFARSQSMGYRVPRIFTLTPKVQTLHFTGMHYLFLIRTIYFIVQLHRMVHEHAPVYPEMYGVTKEPTTKAKFQETEESKARYKISLPDILNGKDTRTTLMIKNIPNKYTQKMLLQKIDSQHRMQYNFFYLPIDFKVKIRLINFCQNKCNVGYAFINFVHPLYILRFYENMNARKWEKFNSEKICQLTYARIQGLDALLEHFYCSSVMSHQVLLKGVQENRIQRQSR